MIIIKDNTITINGHTKKLVEKGGLFEYVYQIKKTQVNVASIEHLKKHLASQQWADIFTHKYNSSI